MICYNYVYRSIYTISSVLNGLGIDLVAVNILDSDLKLSGLKAMSNGHAMLASKASIACPLHVIRYDFNCHAALRPSRR